MKVFRATAYGFNPTNFVIAAKSVENATEIARNQDMGSVDAEDVWEIDHLQTNVEYECVLEQF